MTSFRNLRPQWKPEPGDKSKAFSLNSIFFSLLRAHVVLHRNGCFFYGIDVSAGAERHQRGWRPASVKVLPPQNAGVADAALRRQRLRGHWRLTRRSSRRVGRKNGPSHRPSEAFQEDEDEDVPKPASKSVGALRFSCFALSDNMLNAISGASAASCVFVLFLLLCYLKNWLHCTSVASLAFPWAWASFPACVLHFWSIFSVSFKSPTCWMTDQGYVSLDHHSLPAALNSLNFISFNRRDNRIIQKI